MLYLHWQVILSLMQTSRMISLNDLISFPRYAVLQSFACLQRSGWRGSSTILHCSPQNRQCCWKSNVKSSERRFIFALGWSQYYYAAWLMLPPFRLRWRRMCSFDVYVETQLWWQVKLMSLSASYWRFSDTWTSSPLLWLDSIIFSIRAPFAITGFPADLVPQMTHSSFISSILDVFNWDRLQWETEPANR